MNHNDLKEHLDKRFDRIENKIDNHLERISKAEESLIWMKGHLKVATTFIVTLASAAIAAYFKYIHKL